ncbi:MAG: flagellar motor switch protein FliG [Sphingomonadaceae bacterium]
MADVMEKSADNGVNAAPARPNIGDEQAAAILLLLFSEDEAAQILSRLEPDEVQQLSKVMYSVADIGAPEINVVLDRFVDRARHRTTVGYKADLQIESMLTAALGEQRAEAIVSRTAPKKKAAPNLEPLKWMASKDIVAMIEDEHPQIAALVLSFLSSDSAAEVLKLLPESEQDDIVYRLATLGKVSADAIGTIEQLLNAFHAPQASAPVETGGNSASEIAAIMNLIGKKQSKRVIKSLAKRDKGIAGAIEDQMFTFADLVTLEVKDLGTVMRGVDNDSLVPALKGADDQLRERILSCMSSRAAQTLEDEIEERGPIPMADVIEAQRQVVAHARKLADNGEIVIGGSSDEYL